MRVKAIIAYDGGHFYGFQRQKSTPNTVTQHFEESLKKINILSSIRGSGRTDSDVHATHQVIDFEIPHFWTNLDKLKSELNKRLKGVKVRKLCFVVDDFHARFWAKKREYKYIFKTTPLNPFEENYISYYPLFDEDILKNALKLFEGTHDFTLFSKRGSVTHTNIRHIYKTSYKRYKNYHIITFEANGFLRSQVRMMVEASMNCALNKITIQDIKAQINLKATYSKTLAQPYGLYLTNVKY
ncbi:MAG: tRNA pseudouridine(38-40) synthase TruA [Sulfurovum sp.]|nr:MAG: tRNA pseudouridine(38-40) synthase TruA [Sulfurovum sp.]